MQFLDYLRMLTTPDKSRWQPMLMGLALFAAGTGAAVLLRPSELVATALSMLALVAWVAGACAMLGYVRWFFASEILEAKRNNAGSDERDNK